ncbi:Hypothetical predicted protein [Marmota monax]|uniref:Uncharacterized protein n=1 Tax=Marmota monax TaxID=9995 RepID=A0A5E4AXL4_MARMO|nr:Hypothetical predicted protein [Marmota monax]
MAVGGLRMGTAAGLTTCPSGEAGLHQGSEPPPQPVSSANAALPPCQVYPVGRGQHGPALQAKRRDCEDPVSRGGRCQSPRGWSWEGEDSQARQMPDFLPSVPPQPLPSAMPYAIIPQARVREAQEALRRPWHLVLKYVPGTCSPPEGAHGPLLSLCASDVALIRSGARLQVESSLHPPPSLCKCL